MTPGERAATEVVAARSTSAVGWLTAVLVDPWAERAATMVGCFRGAGFCVF